MKASKIMKMFTRCAVAALTFLDVLFVISVAAGIIRTIDRHGLSSEYLPTYLVILGLCLVIMIPLRKYWTREIPLRPVSGDINWSSLRYDISKTAGKVLYVSGMIVRFAGMAIKAAFAAATIWWLAFTGGLLTTRQGLKITACAVCVCLLVKAYHVISDIIDNMVRRMFPAAPEDPEETLRREREREAKEWMRRWEEEMESEYEAERVMQEILDDIIFSGSI